MARGIQTVRSVRACWRALALVAVAVVLMVSGTARAGTDADRLGLTVKSVVSGKAYPSFVIQPAELVKKLVITLRRHDGRTAKLQAFNVAAGVQKKLAVKQPNGKFTYNAVFDVTWGDSSTSRFELRYELTRVGKLKLDIKPGDIDMDACTATFRMSNPAARVELTITGKSGKQLAQISKALHNAAGGTDLKFKWKKPKGEIHHMDLKVWDIAGFWTGVRITPFSISIPHDDVIFDSGKHYIKPSEAPKLKATMATIRSKIKEHGTLLELKLYVAGYTDTVGTKQYNRNLSNNRARAISNWFRSHGLRIPISYQGFGEEVLAKPTPDETPEQANRRALYILSTQDPVGFSAIPRSNWKKL